MKSSNHEFEMYVLVENKPIKEYHHEGSVFVEGRAGSEYTIRLRNSAAQRALFVLAVDGLSVLDGQQSSDKSPGYVLSAGETLDVKAYIVDNSTGAKFVFGHKEESYSAQVGQGTDNVGVIGAKVFREKKASYSVDPGWAYPTVRTFRSKASTKSMGSGPVYGLYGHSGSFGIAGGWTTNATSPTLSARGIAASSNVATGIGSNSATSFDPMDCATMDCTADLAGMEQEKLGTVFGDATEWKTEKTAFERATTFPEASLVIYYDTRKNLEKRGIKFRKEVAPLPNPFPANPEGCPTPPGWRK